MMKKKWAYARDPFTEVKVTRRQPLNPDSPFVLKSKGPGITETHKKNGRACRSGESPFDLVPLQYVPTISGNVVVDDPVNHPKHYTSHPSGVECIDITRHMSFNLGNVVKYLWRAGLKDSDCTIQDLEKGAFYLADEIAKRKREAGKS